VKLFTWLDTWQRDTVTKGFGYHDGARKYLEGLKSSDINKKQKAVRSAVEWLIRR